jgi:peptide/nickel transport system substrate-binding protein
MVSPTITSDSANSRSVSRRDFLKASATQLALIGSAVGLGACGSSGSAPSSGPTPSKPKRGGTLRVGLTGGGSSDSLNPLNQPTVVDGALCTQLYDYLAVFDEHGVPKLNLLDEVSANSDASAWTLRLKSGVTFHNGKTLTADDLIYTFQQIQNPKSAAAASSLITPIDSKNAMKLDRFTVRLPCTKPFSTFQEVLPNLNIMVIPVGFNAKRPIGTGPFKVRSFNPGTDAQFERFDSYWQEGLPYVDGLHIVDFGDETSQVSGLLSGQLDCIGGLSIGSIASVRNGGGKVLVSRSGAWTPFTMRVDRPPFNDPMVLKAMKLIPDRAQMLQQVFGGHGLTANDLFSIWDPFYDRHLPQRPHDVSEAKALLKRAGQTGLQLELVTAPFFPGVTLLAQVFAQQASDAGVKVTIRQITTTDFYGPNYLKWDFAMDYWAYNPYFPQVSLAVAPTAPWNECHFGSPEHSRLYELALRTVDSSKREEISHDMQEIEWDSDGYIIPYFPPVIDAYAKRVHGVAGGKIGVSFNNFDFKQMWV